MLLRYYVNSVVKVVHNYMFSLGKIFPSSSGTAVTSSSSVPLLSLFVSAHPPTTQLFPPCWNFFVMSGPPTLETISVTLGDVTARIEDLGSIVKKIHEVQLVHDERFNEIASEIDEVKSGAGADVGKTNHSGFRHFGLQPAKE